MRIPYSEIASILEGAPDCKSMNDVFAQIGFPVESVEEFGGDIIFDIEIPSNRGDLLSVYEVIKQINIYIENSRLKEDPLLNAISLDYRPDPSILEVKDSEFAPLYYGIIFDVRVKESPSEFENRIQKLGFNSVNNIVDATNFICAYYGQPMHAFDYSKIKNGKVIVRKSQEGEQFIGLDGKERILKEGVGVIADNEKILALAGVLGSSNCETTFNTKTIFLECAHFNHRDVYYAAKTSGIETESSYRFKRKVPYSFAPRAINVFCSLLKDDIKFIRAIKYDNTKKVTNKIVVDTDFINKRIGTNIPKDKVISILSKSGCDVKERNDTIIVCPPEQRDDLKIKEDIVEEVARFYGYTNIDSKTALKISKSDVNVYEDNLGKIRSYLVDNSFYECVSTSFIDSKIINKLGLDINLLIQVNAIKNPDKFLRNKILFTLLDVYRTNLSYGVDKINIFEIGKVFNLGMEKYIENENLCIISNHFSARDLKEFVTNVGNITGCNIGIVNAQDRFSDNTFAIMYENNVLGYGGEVKKAVLSHFEIKFSDVYYVEFNVSNLLDKKPMEKRYKNIPKFAPLKIDISFILNRDVEYKAIKDFISNLKISYLERFELMDVFTDTKIGQDKKSYTIRLYFQHPERTLQKKEIQTDIENIFSSLKNKFNATKRE